MEPPPRQKALQLVTLFHAAGLAFENLTDGGSHGHFPTTGVFYPATDAEQLGARIRAHAQALEPVRSPLDDVWNVAEGFHVIDDGGATPETANLWKRGFGPGIGALALKCTDQRCLLAADVASRTDMNQHIEFVAAAQDIVTEIAPGVAVGDSLTQQFDGLVVLGADKYIGHIRLYGESGEDHAFNQLVRVALE